MEVVYATDVLDEVAASAAYYEEEVNGLGIAFLGKLAVMHLKRRPNYWQERR